MNRRIALALAAMLAVGGCSAQSVATAVTAAPPTTVMRTGQTSDLVAPTVAPTPILVPVTPTPVVTTATPAPCPTTSGVLCVTFASFLTDLNAGGSALDKYTPISVKDLTTAYGTFASDPDVKGSGIGSENPHAFASCVDMGTVPAERPVYCMDQTIFALQAVHRLPGNAAAMGLASAMARYDVRSGVFKAAANMAILIGGLLDYAE